MDVFSPFTKDSKILFYEVIVEFFSSDYHMASDNKYSAGFFKDKELAEKYEKILEDRISDSIKKSAMAKAIWCSEAYRGNVDDFYETELAEINNKGDYVVSVVACLNPILFEKESDISDTADIEVLMRIIGY